MIRKGLDPIDPHHKLYSYAMHTLYKVGQGILYSLVPIVYF